MPQYSTKEPKEAPRKSSRAVANEAEKRAGKALAPPEKSSPVTESLPNIEALVERQLHMNPSQWQKFKEEKLAGLEGSAHAEWSSRFEQAETAYQEHLFYLTHTLPGCEDESIDKIRKQARVEDGLEKLRSRMASTTGISRMESYSKVYEERLDFIDTLKAQLRLAGERMAYASDTETERLKKEIDQTRELLHAIVQETLSFASESGSKESAINQVVVNDQVKPRMVRALSPETLMYIFNENMGYAFNALHRNRQQPLGQAAIRAARYLSRATLEVRRIRQELEAENLLNDNFRKLERDRKALDRMGKELAGLKEEKPVAPAKGMAKSGEDAHSEAGKILGKAGISSYEELMERLRTFLLKVTRAFDESRFEAKAGGL